MSDTENTLPEDLTPFEQDCLKLKAMFDAVDQENALSLLLASTSLNFELERGGGRMSAREGIALKNLANNVAPVKRLILSVCEQALNRNTQIDTPEVVVENSSTTTS